MADLGAHRDASAWCTGAFCLQHAVRINYAGKTVLIFGGVGLWALDAGAAFELRCVGLVNAILMALGQFWYSAFWGSPAAIVSYVTSDPRHVLNGCTKGCSGAPRPALMIFCAFCYYATFCGLFAWASALEDGATLPFAYGTAASAWHGWCGCVLMVSAVLTRTGHGTQLPSAEQSKLTGSLGVSSSASGMPAAPHELELLIGPTPTVPLARGAVPPPSRAGLFRFDTLRTV